MSLSRPLGNNSTSQSLPYDLIVTLAEKIHDESTTATLLSCALVSRSWRTACRPYILRRIKITNEDQLVAVEELVTLDTTAGLLIRELLIAPHRQPVPEPSAWISRVPLLLPSKLPRLREIHLIQLYEFGDYMTPEFFHDFSNFSAVDTLMVRNCSLSLRMVYACACALPSLHHLHIDFLLPMPSVDQLWAPPPQIHDPHLHSIILKIGDMYPGGLQDALAWTLASTSRETVRTFGALVYFAQAPVIMEYLNVCGAQLYSVELQLALSLGSPIEYEMIKDGLSLVPCTGLRLLTLRSDSPTCAAVVSFLAEVSSPFIRTVVFWVSSGEDLASLPNCSALAAPLDGSNLRHLEEVRFVYDGPLEQRLVMDKLRGELSSVASRGLLRVTAA